MIGIARRLVLVLLVSVAGAATALDYPTHAVKWIVPYPPGGSTDVLARMMSQWLSEKMGQSFVIENKAGGGGLIAMTNGCPRASCRFCAITRAVESVALPGPNGTTMVTWRAG